MALLVRAYRFLIKIDSNGYWVKVKSVESWIGLTTSTFVSFWVRADLGRMTFEMDVFTLCLNLNGFQSSGSPKLLIVLNSIDGSLADSLYSILDEISLPNGLVVSFCWIYSRSLLLI